MKKGRAAQVPTMALFAQSHPSFPYQVVNQFRQNQVLGQLGQQFALRGKRRNLFIFGRSSRTWHLPRFELGIERDALY